MPSKTQPNTAVAGARASESPERNEVAPPKTLSIPEAGWIYFGLSKNGSCDAAERGEIPYILVGRLKRVSIARMERMMEEGVGIVAPPTQSVETPVKGPARSSKYPRSVTKPRRTPEPANAS